MKRRLPTYAHGFACVLVLVIAACTSVRPPAASGPDPLQAARRALAQGNPQEALAVLPTHAVNQAVDAEQLRLRAQAQFALGQPASATQALVQRASLLNGARARAANGDLIWNGLLHSNLAGMTPRTLAALDPTTRGWIELALLVQQHASLERLVDWQSRFPDHPAAARLQALLPSAGTANATPAPAVPLPQGGELREAGSGPTALLLPVSGPLASAAATIRRGVDAACSAAGAPAPRVYDTTDDPTLVQSKAQRAVEAGAGVIIGPLSKAGTASLNRAGPLPVPVIALNYLEPSTLPSRSLLQFGLSPNDEVRQAVADAARRGLHRVVALVPRGVRGDALLATLRTRLATTGGTLLDAAQYAPGTTDFTAMVARLLKFTPPTDEEKAIYKATGKIKPFEERRRQDVDFIFISGSATDDRMIVAMLRYSGAIHLPIYATSEIASSAPNADILDVRFCDTPWKLQPGDDWNAVRARLLAAVDGQTQLVPLYALGLDAGRLSLQLRRGGLTDTQELAGFTGALRIDATGVVERGLVCARMTAAGPQMLDGYAAQVPGPVDAAVRTVIPDPVPASIPAAATYDLPWLRHGAARSRPDAPLAAPGYP